MFYGSPVVESVQEKKDSDCNIGCCQQCSVKEVLFQVCSLIPVILSLLDSDELIDFSLISSNKTVNNSNPARL